MSTKAGKITLMASLIILTMAGVVLVGGIPAAEAGTFVSGNVAFGSPIAVLGFSFGNPYLYGPVYSDPASCPEGPVYYYPSYRVYAPYYPRFSYQYYPQPTYFPRYHRSHGYRDATPYVARGGYGYRYGGHGYVHGYATAYRGGRGSGHGHGYAHRTGR
jgi:hypothetical protein